MHNFYRCSVAVERISEYKRGEKMEKQQFRWESEQHNILQENERKIDLSVGNLISNVKL